jgi:ankyrin repeat protein
MSDIDWQPVKNSDGKKNVKANGTSTDHADSIEERFTSNKTVFGLSDSSSYTIPFAAEHMQHVKNSREIQEKNKELSLKAFTFLEAKDKIGLFRFIEQISNYGKGMQLIDIINERGFTLMHMACFKNLEEIAIRLLEKALN